MKVRGTTPKMEVVNETSGRMIAGLPVDKPTLTATSRSIGLFFSVNVKEWPTQPFSVDVSCRSKIKTPLWTQLAVDLKMPLSMAVPDNDSVVSSVAVPDIPASVNFGTQDWNTGPVV